MNESAKPREANNYIIQSQEAEKITDRARRNKEAKLTKVAGFDPDNIHYSNYFIEGIRIKQDNKLDVIKFLSGVKISRLHTDKVSGAIYSFIIEDKDIDGNAITTLFVQGDWIIRNVTLSKRNKFVPCRNEAFITIFGEKD